LTKKFEPIELLLLAVATRCATALGFGMFFALRTTRFLASILGSMAISDFFIAYSATKKI
jgi:hypothetical protein